MTIIVNGQKIEPIKTAPKNGCPVWAQIANLPAPEETMRKETEFPKRIVRRAWIYWTDEGPTLSELGGGRWAIVQVSPDFQYNTYTFYIDGWFPWFTPNLAPTMAAVAA